LGNGITGDEMNQTEDKGDYDPDNRQREQEAANDERGHRACSISGLREEKEYLAALLHFGGVERIMLNLFQFKAR
jgi:hypothetical protein